MKQKWKRWKTNKNSKQELGGGGGISQRGVIWYMCDFLYPDWEVESWRPLASSRSLPARARYTPRRTPTVRKKHTKNGMTRHFHWSQICVCGGRVIIHFVFLFPNDCLLLSCKQESSHSSDFVADSAAAAAAAATTTGGGRGGVTATTMLKNVFRVSLIVATFFPSINFFFLAFSSLFLCFFLFRSFSLSTLEDFGLATVLSLQWSMVNWTHLVVGALL